MRTRPVFRWVSAALLCCAGLAAAADKADAPPKAKEPAKAAPKAQPKPQPKPPAKPDNTQVLGKTNLRYLLYVPQDYDAKRKYPLIVAAQYKDDQAAQAYKNWEELAKKDELFLAALNFPKGSKENREERLTELVEHLCKTYEGIDRKGLVLIGFDGGAAQAIKYVATYPRCFAIALAMDLRSLADVRKIKPQPKPSLVDGTHLLVACDRDYLKTGPVLVAARGHLESLGVAVRCQEVTPAGMGKPSEDETKVILEAVRSLYDSERRAKVAERLHTEAEAARKKSEEEAKKVAAAKTKSAGDTPAPGKAEPKADPKADSKTEPKAEPKTEPKANPDDLLVAAQEAYEKREVVQALRLYEQLAKLKPGSDYARVAKQRIQELRSEPTLKRLIADAEAEEKAAPLLNVARNYRLAGKKDKAVASYEQVIEKFPDSSFAETARRELDALRSQ
jgi:predicted esterase